MQGGWRGCVGYPDVGAPAGDGRVKDGERDGLCCEYGGRDGERDGRVRDGERDGRVL